MDEMTQATDEWSPSIIFKKWWGIFVISLVLILLIVGSIYILLPFIHSIILAVTFAIVTHPFFRYLWQKRGWKKGWAALTTCLLVFFLIITPLITIFSMLISQGQATIRSIYHLTKPHLISNSAEKTLPLSTHPIDESNENPESTDSHHSSSHLIPTNEKKSKEEESELSLEQGIERLLQWLSDKQILRHTDPTEIKRWLMDQSGYIINKLKKALLHITQRSAGVLIQFVLMLFILFYFLRDGDKITLYLWQMTALPKEYRFLINQRVEAVIRSVILGTLVTALIQGGLAAIGFALVGISWLFSGILVAIASFVPVIGTALVWVPCVIYLFLINRIGAAIFLAFYCILVVGTVDNIIRPWFFRENTGMSSFVAFFALFGGIHCFGILGVIYGPLIFGTLALLVYLLLLHRELESKMLTPPNIQKNNQLVD